MPILTSCISSKFSNWKGLALPSALLLLAATLGAQFPQYPAEDEAPKRLPNGKLQSDEILKADYQANLKDLEQLRRLNEAIGEELEKNKGLVLSMKCMKDLEEIEKTAKRMRTRMKRY